MKKLVTLVFAGFALGACAGASYPVIGADKPNIIILGEDHSDGTFSKNSRVFRAVLAKLNSQLNEAGFDVYDETAVTSDKFVQGRINRSDAEVIGIAKSIDMVPIDVAVIFHLYGKRRVFDYIAKVKARIQARAINVQTGQILADVNRSLPVTNIPSNCSGSCISEHFVEPAEGLAFGVGQELKIKLVHIVKLYTDDGKALPTRYRLIFDGFNNEDYYDIEEYFKSFSGYVSHRILRMTPKKKIYYYKTTSGGARLHRNLRRMLDHLGLQGNVNFSGNTFTVEYISVRR